MKDPPVNLYRHFQEDVRDVISTIKYHGSNRKANVENLYDADIIITTYRTLYSDFSKDKSPLNNTEWYRLVLDEGKTDDWLSRNSNISDDS